jgi:antitoxin component of MazEF toxin-antitoxin module
MMAVVNARKVGHSLVVTIPHEYVVLFGIEEGDNFQVVAIREGILLEPMKKWLARGGWLNNFPSVSVREPGEGET